MTDFITKILQPLFDFLTILVNKFGTKFVIAIGSIGALVYIAFEKVLPECPQWIFPVCIAVIAICYFVFRSKQELGATPPQTGEPTK